MPRDPLPLPQLAHAIHLSGSPRRGVVDGMNDATNDHPDPRTLAELQAQMIAEAEAERDMRPEDIGKQPTALDSPLAMRLWDDFLRR